MDQYFNWFEKALDHVQFIYLSLDLTMYGPIKTMKDSWLNDEVMEESRWDDAKHNLTPYMNILLLTKLNLWSLFDLLNPTPWRNNMAM